MHILENNLYKEDIEKCHALAIPWDCFRNKSILITGASGLIGSFLIDVLMQKNLKCHIYAVGRNVQKAKMRFAPYWDSEEFHFVETDINKEILVESDTIDYIIHGASNTHPIAYAEDPIGTITTNVIGTYNILELASVKRTKRVAFLSSVEVYGENRGDCEKFKEDYCGYIDCNTMRAGYPESKRAGEALCQAYIKQKQLDIVIPRLPRTYGPTMQMTDSKAIAQFIKKGIAKEDVILKSEGTQLYSYCHVLDTVSGILWCLTEGKCGEAYNIADDASDIQMKDLANIIAQYAGTKVIFDHPDVVEQAGYSKATKALLDSEKLQKLGWKAVYDMSEGLRRTIEILRGV